MTTKSARAFCRKHRILVSYEKLGIKLIPTDRMYYPQGFWTRTHKLSRAVAYWKDIGALP